MMARGGMRIGEVLKLTPADINDRRLTLRDPKSGRDQRTGSNLDLWIYKIPPSLPVLVFTNLSFHYLYNNVYR